MVESRFSRSAQFPVKTIFPASAKWLSTGAPAFFSAVL